jgi:hypothetical protein
MAEKLVNDLQVGLVRFFAWLHFSVFGFGFLERPR